MDLKFKHKKSKRTTRHKDLYWFVSITETTINS